MNNIDKHRILIAIGSQYQSVDIGGDFARAYKKGLAEVTPEMAKMFSPEPPNLKLFIRPADRMWPLKAGNELFADAPDAEVHQNRQFRFEVAFGESKIIEGEPIIETLQQMADLVDSLIVSFRPFLA